MRWLRDIPIQRKLRLVILLTTSAALLLASIVFVASERVTFRRAMARDLTVLADALANNSTAALAFNDASTAAEILGALKAEPYVVAACLYARDGAIFARYSRDATKRAFPAQPGEDGIVLLVLMGSLLVAFALSSRLQRAISEPILALADTAKVISEQKDYSVRAAQQGRDEIGLLTNAFNQMLTSIEDSENALHGAYRALQAEIAERRRVQEALTALNATLEQRIAERTAAAEAANRAKSEFLANMSHELRTPLNSVIGFANVLLRNKAGNLRSEDLTFLDRIAANGKHLLRLINEILDLSKIEAQRVEVELAPVSLAALVHEVIAQFSPQLRGRDLTLAVELPPSMLPLETDAARLRQILINIIDNAVKFTERGTVTVCVRCDPHTDRPARIDVIDVGTGIPQERLGTIFKAFQQGDPTSARRYGGTGLGLAISQALCQLLGYRLEVHSELGKGSTFSLILAPSGGEAATSPPAAAAQAMAPEEPTGLEGWVVLVIDDEPDARLLLSELIEECGCRVVTASSGEQALQMARQVRPDLITLDLLMPRMDGWEVLKALRADPELAAIPVVVISMVADEKRGTILGVVDVLQKPISQEEVRAVLGRALRPESGKVLVVDDEEDARRLLAGYLAEEAVQIRTAANGREAMEALNVFSPDLILLDLLMPVMSGMTFLRTLRTDPRHRHLPVVIVTARQLSREETRRLRTQAQAVLQKTEDLEQELKRTLHDLLKRAAGRPTLSSAGPASAAVRPPGEDQGGDVWSAVESAGGLPMNEEDCLDLTALDRLGRLKGGAQFVREMIDIFLGYAPQKIAEAQAAAQAGDLAAVGHAVHPLISGAGNVGAPVVRELASRIERAASTNDRQPIASLLRELDEAFARAKVRLEEARRSLPP